MVGTTGASGPALRVRLQLLTVALLAVKGGAGDADAPEMPLANVADEVAGIADSCEACLAKGGGWCLIDHRCGEDDPEHCDADSLIGLAGFTDDCAADIEGKQPKGRPAIDKGVLVSYTFENGTCCMGLGIVHRAYHVLEEYTLLLANSSREEVKTERWNRRKPGKKKDENSEYHDMEFRYFLPSELKLISSIRPNDVVQAHFAVKGSKSSDVVGGGAMSDDDSLEVALVKSRRTEAAFVINTTIDTVAVNFTTDFIVSILPRDFVVDPTNWTTPPAFHEEL